MDKKHPSEYLNEMEDWLEHQYDPGHWIGTGRVPPHIKNGGAGLGIAFLTIGVTGLIADLIAFIDVLQNYSGWEFANQLIGGVIIAMIISLSLIFGGVKKLRQSRSISSEQRD